VGSGWRDLPRRERVRLGFGVVELVAWSGLDSAVGLLLRPERRLVDV
jgi:hypothetical protein